MSIKLTRRQVAVVGGASRAALEGDAVICELAWRSAKRKGLEGPFAGGRAQTRKRIAFSMVGLTHPPSG